MDAIASADDVRDALTLLWRADVPAAPRPGPRPKVGLTRIVEEGVAVADLLGMAGVSMRAIGERLGTTAMALYSHVPNKAVLIELMVDHVHGELAEVAMAEATGDWRAELERWADTALEFHVRHPWLLRRPQARAAMGPNTAAVIDGLAAIVMKAGLDGARARALISGLFHLVRGAADAIVEGRRAPSSDTENDEAWWAAHQDALAQLVPDLADRYPSVTSLERADAGPVGDPETFLEDRSRAVFLDEIGLLLDGVGANRRAAARGQ